MTPNWDKLGKERQAKDQALYESRLVEPDTRPRITLDDAIEQMDTFNEQSLEMGVPLTPCSILLLAAAKAFACKECNGTGCIQRYWNQNGRESDISIYPCPACAEFRKIAREGVEG